MVKKPSRKTIVAKLDKLFSELIRSKGYCERCNRKPPQVVLNCAHIYSRTYKWMRWDKENALSLCVGCHFWWHQNPAEAGRWVAEVRDFTYLEKLRQKNEPIKTWQLQELLTNLTSGSKI